MTDQKERVCVKRMGSFFLPFRDLYAFNNVLKIVDTKFLEGDAVSVRDMLRLARWMTETYPEPVVVYAVDNRPGLYKEFTESVKTKDFTKHVEFADIVSREGLLIKI